MVFKKKDKPELYPSSYRPISLICADSKIYSKIIAVRLSKIITPLVSMRQHGFIPGRDTTDHIRRAIALFDWAQVYQQPLAMILLDAEKAFDRVSWDFLWRLLKTKGLSQTSIQSLYISPVACVRIGGQESQLFPISRGTRQGCPCSPLLFSI